MANVESTNQLSLLNDIVPEITFIYQPGGDNKGKNCSSWSTLVKNLQASGPGRKVVLIDDSLVSPAVIPPGTYALPNTEIRSLEFKAGGTRLDLGSFTVGGVVLEGVKKLSGALIVTNQGNTPCINIDGMTFELNDRVIVNSGNAPLLTVAGGSGATLMYRGRSILGVDTINVDPGETLIVLAFEDSNYGDEVTIGDATSVGAIFRDPTCTFTQPAGNWAGAAWTDTLLGEAVATLYSAGTPGDWAASAPTDVNDAIDRLATAVEGLLGGPIP